MSTQYKQKKAELEKLIGKATPDQGPLLRELCSRFCEKPFPRKLGAAELWIDLWGKLTEEGKKALVETPDPCLNHVESRVRKPDRAENLWIGFERLLKHDQDLLLEGLRLYPHALCRAAEVIGPLSDEDWTELESTLLQHRLWSVPKDPDEEQFWEAADELEPFRDLPQQVLDFLDSGRATDKAPVKEFVDSLERYLLRKKIEKIRLATYEKLRVHTEGRVVKLDQTSS